MTEPVVFWLSFDKALSSLSYLKKPKHMLIKEHKNFIAHTIKE